MPFDQDSFELARGYEAAPHGTDPVLEALFVARAGLSDPARWQKEAFGRRGGPRCAWGVVIDAASAMHPNDNDAMVLLVGAVIPVLNRETAGGSVVGFNDAPSTTHADVLALFDRAIAARRSEA